MNSVDAPRADANHFQNPNSAANTEEKTKLDAALVDAEQNHGESEVLDALFALAQFQARIGAKEACYTAYDAIVDKPKVSTGKKIDANMGKLRVAIFYNDVETIRPLIVATKKMVEDGGDWDRRNRLKVYAWYDDAWWNTKLGKMEGYFHGGMGRAAPLYGRYHDGPQRCLIGHDTAGRPIYSGTKVPFGNCSGALEVYYSS